MSDVIRVRVSVKGGLGEGLVRWPQKEKVTVLGKQAALGSELLDLGVDLVCAALASARFLCSGIKEERRFMTCEKERFVYRTQRDGSVRHCQIAAFLVHEPFIVNLSREQLKG